MADTPPASPMTAVAMTLQFDVLGYPAPQGNKTPIVVQAAGQKPRAVLIEGPDAGMRQRHKNWRSAVSAVARNVADVTAGTPLDGPLVLMVLFRFPMAAARSKAVHAVGWCPKVSAPDSDKLLRATGDALKEGGLIADDARFCIVLAGKIEVVGWTGAQVGIRPYVGELGSGLDRFLQPAP